MKFWLHCLRFCRTPRMVGLLWQIALTPFRMICTHLGAPCCHAVGVPRWKLTNRRWGLLKKHLGSAGEGKLQGRMRPPSTSIGTLIHASELVPDSPDLPCDTFYALMHPSGLRVFRHDSFYIHLSISPDSFPNSPDSPLSPNCSGVVIFTRT